MRIKIVHDIGEKAPAGKMADVELHFVDAVDAELRGLRLTGFAIWERRTRDGFNVTFPARAYVVNGERRSWALLRGIADDERGRGLSDLIIATWQEERDVKSRARSERDVGRQPHEDARARQGDGDGHAYPTRRGGRR